MAKETLIRCGDCQGSFWWPKGKPLPDPCPVCKGTGIARDDAKPWTGGTGPSIRREGVQKAVDDVANAVMDSSVERANMAADVLGIDHSETRHMHLTDLNDRQKPGDVAAKMPTNAVQQHMQATGEGGMTSAAQPTVQLGGQRVTPQAAAAMTRVGPYAGAGEYTAKNVTSMHAAMRQRVENEGRINRR